MAHTTCLTQLCFVLLCSVAGVRTDPPEHASFAQTNQTSAQAIMVEDLHVQDGLRNSPWHCRIRHSTAPAQLHDQQTAPHHSTRIKGRPRHYGFIGHGSAVAMVASNPFVLVAQSWNRLRMLLGLRRASA
ncbi:uncharacterized protein LOC142566255 [Dermacentor variabilis]|uniref:uncharacterized protein LOC142566255 n=1 Tax=Dermacentor variabilis TaxID=34621 RepID=UPI003F5CAD06